jgi:hypothetical protein
MAKCFLLVAVLMLVACDHTSVDSGIKADADYIPDFDNSANDNNVDNFDADGLSPDEQTDETVEEEIPDVDCMGQIANDYCKSANECGVGAPYLGATLCSGDKLYICVSAYSPCWSGVQDKTTDCAAEKGRCFAKEENGCEAQCVPRTEITPLDPFTGHWREVALVKWGTGEVVDVTATSIAGISFQENKFSIVWNGDLRMYTGTYENSLIKGERVTRWFFDEWFSEGFFCDYSVSYDDTANRWTFLNRTNGWKNCLIYGPQDVGSEYKGHVFEPVQ